MLSNIWQWALLGTSRAIKRQKSAFKPPKRTLKSQSGILKSQSGTLQLESAIVKCVQSAYKVRTGNPTIFWQKEGRSTSLERGESSSVSCTTFGNVLTESDHSHDR
jgi:hypothetical protein